MCGEAYILYGVIDAHFSLITQLFSLIRPIAALCTVTLDLSTDCRFIPAHDLRDFVFESGPLSIMRISGIVTHWRTACI